MTTRRRSWAEPFKIKMVELLKTTTLEEREHAIVEAGYNTFLAMNDDDLYRRACYRSAATRCSSTPAASCRTFRRSNSRRRRGLKFIYEPAQLGFFLGRFAPVTL